MKNHFGFIFIFVLFFVNPVFSQILYKNNVTASYYADDFHGKKTSNGETFNMNDFTCAHKLFPFDTILKVTNLSNQKSVNVRVNDRGPFVSNREIDLSKAAAKQLEMLLSGTANVKIEILELKPHSKASLQSAKKACEISKIQFVDLTYLNSENKNSSDKNSIAKISDGKFYDIQVGAFKNKENAVLLAKKLKSLGFSDIVFQKTKNQNEITKVVLKKIPSEKVLETENQLKSNGFSEYTVRLRKQY